MNSSKGSPSRPATRRSGRAVLEARGVWVSFIAGAVAGVLLPLFDVVVAAEAQGNFLAAAAGIGVFFASTTVVSISIFLSSSSALGSELRKHGISQRLIGYTHKAVVLAIVLVMTALAGYLLIDAGSTPWEWIAYPHSALLGGALLASVVAFYRVFYIVLHTVTTLGR